MCVSFPAEREASHCGIAKKRQVVADFKATRVFYSDGTVAVVRSDDSVILYPSDTKAKELN